MAFITTDDFYIVATQDDLEAITPELEDDSEALDSSIAVAQEEISGYLRSRYDIDSIFAQTDDERNPLIVMRMADITLYHLCAKLPGRMNYEVRKERYEAAVKWLQDIQRGNVTLSLPFLDDTDPGNPVKWNSLPKQNSSW